MTRRIPLAVLLPASIDAGLLSLLVVHSETFADVTVKWPIPLNDLHLLLKKHLSSDYLCYKV